MKLNTYRCGCGRIETLPNLKAKPGPCTHGVRYDNGPERGAMTPCCEWGGWKMYTQQVLTSAGAHTLWLATKPNRDGYTWKGAPATDRKFEFIPPAFASVLAQADARREELRASAERSLAAIRLLVKQVLFAHAGGIRTKVPQTIQVTVRQPLLCSAAFGKPITGSQLAAEWEAARTRLSPGFTEGVRQLDPKTFVSRKPTAPENHKQADHILGNALPGPASWTWQRVRGLWVCRIQFMYETDEDAWINSESKLLAYNTIRQIVPDFHALLDPPKYPSRETQP